MCCASAHASDLGLGHTTRSQLCRSFIHFCEHVQTHQHTPWNMEASCVCVCVCVSVSECVYMSALCRSVCGGAIIRLVTPIDLPRARKKDKLLRMRASQLLRCSIAEGQLSSTASSTCWHCQVLPYFFVLVGIQVKGRACAPESKWTDSLTESFSFSGQTMYQDSFHLWRMGDGRPKDSPDCAECRNSLSSVK